MRHWPRIVGVAALLCSTSVGAQMWWQKEELNRGFEEKPAPELLDPLAVVLPAYPKPENLLEYDVAPTARNRVFVDGTSVSVGPDQVVRYVAMIKTPGGANNITYEGILCSNRTRLVYAYGQPDGSWYRARDPKWVRILNDETHPQYFEFARNLFCDTGVPAGGGADIVAALKKAAPRR